MMELRGIKREEIKVRPKTFMDSPELWIPAFSKLILPLRMEVFLFVIANLYTASLFTAAKRLEPLIPSD